MLCEACHERREIIWLGARQWLEPGQFTAGRYQISKATGVHPTKVQRIIKSLIFDQQIDQQTSNVTSLLTIVNWKEYQQIDHQNDQQVISHRSASDQQVITTEELKNERIEEVQSPLPPSVEFMLDSEDKAPSKPKWNPTPSQIMVAGWFRRRPETPWSEKEVKAWKKCPDTLESELELLAAYYKAAISADIDYRRRDLLTLLNNWQGEIDRAKKFQLNGNHNGSNQRHRSEGPDRNKGTANESRINDYSKYRGIARVGDVFPLPDVK